MWENEKRRQRAWLLTSDTLDDFWIKVKTEDWEPFFSKGWCGRQEGPRRKTSSDLSWHFKALQIVFTGNYINPGQLLSLFNWTLLATSSCLTCPFSKGNTRVQSRLYQRQQSEVFCWAHATGYWTAKMLFRKTQPMTSTTLAATTQEGHVSRNAAVETPFTPQEQQRHRCMRFSPNPQNAITLGVPQRKFRLTGARLSPCWWWVRHSASVLETLQGQNYTMQKQPFVEQIGKRF